MRDRTLLARDLRRGRLPPGRPGVQGAQGPPGPTLVLVGVTAAAIPAGEHVIQLGFNCPVGDLAAASLGVNGHLGIVLLGG